MKQLYPYAITMYIHYSPDEIPRRFLERDTLEFEKRKERINYQYQEYVNHNTFFDHVILNFWELDNAKSQLKNIINTYNKKIKFDKIEK